MVVPPGRLRESGARFVVLAIENQDNIDYEMPWRIMGYDYAEYKRQIKEIHKRKRRKSDHMLLSWETAVDGTEESKGHDGFGDFPAAFNDYRMHLVCADDVGLAENCNTQLGLLLRVLAARGDRKRMEALKTATNSIT